MKSTHKGAILGAAAMVGISVTWAMATGHDWGKCIDGAWGPGPCECTPVPRVAWLGGGLCVGVPWAVLAGSICGGVAGRIVRDRRLVMASLGAAVALVLALIGLAIVHCSTDPSVLGLLVRAAMITIPTALVLEHATRPAARVPLATARETR